MRKGASSASPSSAWARHFASAGDPHRLTSTEAVQGRGSQLLYLDFDGVLHPAEVYWHPRRGVYLHPSVQGHRLFENVPLLLEALAGFPKVQVVLSTSWVPSRGFGKTLKRLPLELRARVIGSTFHSEHMLHERWASIGRGYQVLADVERRRPARWVAVDDDVVDWPDEYVGRLVKTDPVLGLRRLGATDELISHFASWAAGDIR